MSRGETSRGTLTADVALVIQSWDPWLADVTGVAEDDARGRTLGELFPELEARGLLAKVRRVAEVGTVEVIAPAFHEFFIACPLRSPSAYFTHMQQHATIAPLRTGEAIVGISIAVEDVTTRREYERELAAQLASDDEGVRLRAVQALSTREDATGPLAAALEDSSWRVRRAAAQGFATVNDAERARALIDIVRDRHRNSAALNAALSAIAQTPADVLPAVVALLDAPESDAERRTYAALALGLLGRRAAVPALLRRLEDPDANVRFHAVEALGRIGAREAAPALAAVAESRDFSVAFAALDALASIGEPSVAARIVPLLDDELLCTAAADALAHLGGAEVIGPLLQLVHRADDMLLPVAGALATLDRRRGRERDGGVLVAELARTSLTPEIEQAIVAALPTAGPAEMEGLALMLEWRQTGTADQALASLLARADVRRTVADILVARGSAAVAPLLAQLDASDDEVRIAAAAALGQIGNPRATASLAVLLDDATEVAVVAAGALGSIGDPAAFEPLVQHLGHPHAAVRQAVVGALNSLAHPAMPERVREMLGDPSPHVRESAARIAGYFGYAHCVGDMVRLSRDADESVRRVALEQLAQFADSGAAAALVDGLSDAHAGIRAAVVRALARATAVPPLPYLLAACGDRDPWVRYYAARSLCRQAAGAAEPATLTTLTTLALGDDVLPVRIAAIEALGEIGGTAAAGTLASLAADPESSVAVAALAALGTVTGEDVLPALLAALRTGERDRQEAALTSIGERGEAAAVAAVGRIAQSGVDPAIRELAVWALGEIGTPEAAATLIALTADPRRSAAAVAALAALARARESQLPALGAGLEHADVEVRCAVADALARTGSRRAIPFLAAALDDASVVVREAAAAALARIDVIDASVGDDEAMASSTGHGAAFARPR